MKNLSVSWEIRCRRLIESPSSTSWQEYLTNWRSASWNGEKALFQDLTSAISMVGSYPMRGGHLAGMRVTGNQRIADEVRSG